MPSLPGSRLPNVHLSPWDHLVLIGYQVKYNLKKAQEKFDADFRDAIKSYLMTLPAERRQLIAADIIKVSIVEKGGNPGLNTTSLEESFINMFRNPAGHSRFITKEDIQALFDAGILGVKKPEEAFNFLFARGQVENRALVMTLPTPVTHELRWQVLVPEAHGGAGVLADLPERVHAASGARLDDQDIELMLPQAAVLAEPDNRVRRATAAEIAAAVGVVADPVTGAEQTVAVRRPRRTRRVVESPTPQADVVRQTPPTQP